MDQPRAKKMMHQYSIPEDLVFEILWRLPAKSIGRFTCVSKLWARIIHSEVFVRRFSLKKQQPHFLFAFNELKIVQKSPLPEIMARLPAKSVGGFNCLCKVRTKTFSRKKGDDKVFMNRPKLVYQEKWNFFTKLTPEFLSTMVYHFKKLHYSYNTPSYVHGLISFLYGEEQVVSNPTTGKSITLPTLINPIIRSFLGYDPIDAKYKVLCSTNVNHQVLTLGSGPQHWRIIPCSTPHHPSGTNSVCIDGVLYYTASSGTKQLLVGFDLRSETLEITCVLPEGTGSYNLLKTTLINYHGKVALVTQVCRYGTFHLWVVEDAKKQNWSKQDLSFPRNSIKGDHSSLKVLGVSEMGEFVYAPILFEELYVYFVDHISNKVTSVKVLGNTKRNIRDSSNAFIFLNHVESLLFM